MGMPRVMISQAAQAVATATATAPAAAATAPATVRTGAYTLEALHAAWKRFIDEHPSEQLLLTAMRHALPRQVGQDSFAVDVDSQAQVEVMKSRMTQLLAFLRDAVGNDMVALDVKLKEGGMQRQVWTDREVAQDMMKNNPDFAQLVKDFDLTLA